MLIHLSYFIEMCHMDPHPFDFVVTKWISRFDPLQEFLRFCQPPFDMFFGNWDTNHFLRRLLLLLILHRPLNQACGHQRSIFQF